MPHVTSRHFILACAAGSYWLEIVLQAGTTSLKRLQLLPSSALHTDPTPGPMGALCLPHAVAPPLPSCVPDAAPYFEAYCLWVPCHFVLQCFLSVCVSWTFAAGEIVSGTAFVGVIFVITAAPLSLRFGTWAPRLLGGSDRVWGRPGGHVGVCACVYTIYICSAGPYLPAATLVLSYMWQREVT